jgi:hypothetical protein
MWLDPNGFSAPNIIWMVPSIGSRHALLPKAILNSIVLILMTPLVQLFEPQLFAFTVSRGWTMRQLDVKNAFLHGLLQEQVYMEQPPGYADPSRPTHVCRLKKALYGLKKAPRAWFHRFSHFLLNVGFTSSQTDSSLFVYSSAPEVIYLLLYVDDIIIIGSNMSLIDSFIRKLRLEFSMKDLGTLNYFLGLEFTHSTTGIFLSQLKYTRDLLLRADLLDSKPLPLL